jgi:hypothetical protein|tara:strand:- start:64 stop:684 length:621 start_codon:yes stop_codon:yes gene_type:complete
MKLNERTQIIIHSVNSTKSSVWNVIGQLHIIQRDKLYKEGNFNSMEDYIKYNEDKFEFGYRQAQKYITTYTELLADEQSSSHNHNSLVNIPLSKLFLITRVPEEHRDEIIEQVVEKGLTRDELSKRIKRSKEQAGTKPEHKEDVIYKLQRQFNTIEQHFNGNIEFTRDLKEEIANWVASAVKHGKNEQISALIVKANEMSKRLKFY